MERINGSNPIEYRQFMEETAAPWLESRLKYGYVETQPGQQMYYERYLSDNPKGVLVLVHGFSEAAAKYQEVIYRFVQAGYHVWAWQQREHGLSYRSTHDASLIHITDFRVLITDLHTFVKEVVKKDESTGKLPLFLFGHSMGGGVSACYAQAYPRDFRKVILSSPMLEMKSSIPTPAAAAAADLLRLLGKGTNPLPGAQPFSGEEAFAESQADSEARYLYWLERQRSRQEWQMCVCTVSTARQFLNLTLSACKGANCRRVRAKVLLLQACADTMVGLGGQEKYIERISGGRLVRFEGVKHEIYMGSDETLEKYYGEIFAFLNEA